jgi:hypothetical protein
MVLMTVYNPQNCWVSGLCPSFRTLDIKIRFRNWMFSFSGEWRETLALLGPLERPHLNHWTVHMAYEPQFWILNYNYDFLKRKDCDYGM